jgi:murein L,D-transpeptidase YcbB/YkuD
LFPLSKKNPDYFAQNNFIVHRVTVGVSAPNAADGSTVAKPVYQYRLKQAPGPKNALGRVKFMFPNDHGVYLHDTPSKELFNRSIRTYSHGCIRVEKPIDLAEYLLRGTEKWTRSAILDTIERKKEKSISLPEEIPVYIQYWTAWVDDEGTVQFRNDIYGYDNVPGARLPVSSPKNPRPQPLPTIQPLRQEVRSPQEESPTAQPPLQPESQPATRLEPSLTPPPEEARQVM